MTTINNPNECFSNENGVLQTDFRNLNSKFRWLRNTISNKNNENILSELESKTKELEILSAKLNLQELIFIEPPSTSSTKIRELEATIEDQELVIRHLELEKSAILSDNQFLKHELTKTERKIESLNTQITTHPVGGNSVKIPIKENKCIFGNIRAQTLDIDSIAKPKLQSKPKKAYIAKNKSIDRHLTPNKLPTIQDDLVNPQARPSSPRPIQRKSDCKIKKDEKSNGNDDEQDLLSKSLPLNSPI